MTTKKIEKQTAYATLCGVKGDSTGYMKFYRIFYEDGPTNEEWVGPYRDTTGAENAAEDEARRLGVDLEWVD